MELTTEKKKIDLQFAPYETDYILPKSEFILGSGFEEANLGYSEESNNHYIGPNKQHILEFDLYYKGHRDRADPRKDPFKHLVQDAPEVLISSFTGSFLMIIYAVKLYNWKEREKIKKKKEELKRDIKEKLDINIVDIICWVLVIFFIIIIIGFLFFGTKSYRESKRNAKLL